MLYLVFAIFSIGAALLQSAYLRAGKGVVPSRRRITYSVIAALATIIQVSIGLIIVQPALLGVLIVLPVFYGVHTIAMRTSLRLRYTFRLGVVLILLSALPLWHGFRPFLQHNTSLPAAPPEEPSAPPTE
jgi:hypothetical protein